MCFGSCIICELFIRQKHIKTDHRRGFLPNPPKGEGSYGNGGEGDGLCVYLGVETDMRVASGEWSSPDFRQRGYGEEIPCVSGNFYFLVLNGCDFL